ncbi:putative ribonuclease H-like domain-containing protein [Tanacetum coccineum]
MLSNSPLSSSSQSTDNKDADEVPGKGDDNLSKRNGQEKEEGASNKEDNQHVQDFRAELDNLLVQQKEGYANNTNRVSTVNPSVSAAEQGFDNADDQEMIDSSIQDVNTTGPKATGIFDDAYDDREEVGAEADLNNLVTTINVSSIPITRIHKDHPIKQIIGDLHSALLARRMSQQNLEELGKRAIGTKWVYRNKKDERGIVVRNKARLVTQGYTQEKVIDYDEVFAYVARIKAIMLFLTYASFMGLIVYQMDVKSAFLYGTIKEEVYVFQPPGFEDPQFPDKVYKVEKALYGLHQAPRAWYETLSTYLLENGYRRGTIDKTLFIKKDRGDILLVQVYVDDIIFGSTKKSLCVEFEQMMHKRFQMSSIGELTFFLGLQVQQKEDGIFISQDKYVADILKKFDLVTVKAASTPIETNKALLKDEEAEDVDVHLYRSMIGSLMYLTASRPDIMFAVCACARFQVTPKTSHLHAVKRIFRYLKGQPKLGLWYPRDSPFDLEAFSDSDYAGASLDRKSTTGGCQFLGKRLISWQCKKQTIVANSTTEAEYVAAANCCGQHIEIRHHFIRDSYEKKLVQVIKIHTDHNVADLLTKAFDVSRKAKRTTEISQSSGPIHLVADETVYKEWEDRMERAAATASSLEAEQDSAGLVNTVRLNLMLPVQVDDVEESNRFEETIDFLNASSVQCALTVNPTIYTTCIEQFWTSAKVKTVNGERQIQALVDKKKVIISETSIRSDLKLDDAEGTDCLPTATIFAELERMGAKTTSWNKFSSTMASAIICLATNQKFNLSKYIFYNMVKNLNGGVKFLMYPRFVQVFLDKQVEGMSKHKGVYVTPSYTKKVFANMKRPCKGFSGRVTPLFSTIMVQATENMGADSATLTDSHSTPTITQPSSSKPQKKKSRRKQRKDSASTEPITEETTPKEHVYTPSYDPPLSGKDRMQLAELMSLCTNLQEKVLDLEKAKTAQAKEITSLKKRVKQLEKRRKSRTSGLRRLRKVGSSSRVESSNDASLGAQEDASKQGRKIKDLDADAEVTLVDETQEMNDDNLMFDTGVLEEQEIKFEKVVEEPVVSVATTTKSIPVSAAEVVTTASANVEVPDELTLAQTLIEIKTAKPKPVTTAATTVTSVRPRAKGIIFHDQEEQVSASTKAFSSSQSQLPQVKDKGKGKMVEPEVPLKKKDQVALDEEMARNLEAQLQAELIEEERLARQKEEEANIALIESWDNTQAMMEADFELAQRLQAEEHGEITIEERSRLFVELMNRRKKHFAKLRAEEIRRKPPTKAQKRNQMSTYLKNMAGFKHSQLKSKSYDEIQKLFDKEMKRVNTFVDMNSEVVKGSETRTEESSKRAGDELEFDKSKKQKIDEHVEAEKDDDPEEEEMKKHMEIVQDEEEIAIDAIPLATKPPMIVEYKIVKEGQKGFYHLIRADGSSKRYSSMIRMLQGIDREDLETLWKLVKEKHGINRPVDEYERVLWGDMKVMFEPDIKSEVWRSLQGYKVTVWKLFDNCGVHFVRFKNLHIFMLVEKRYPLTPITISNMLNKKLQADRWNEMCYQLLKLMTKQEKGQ